MLSKSEKGLLLGCKENGLYNVWIMHSRATNFVKNVRIVEDVFPAKEGLSDDENDSQQNSSPPNISTEAQMPVSNLPVEPSNRRTAPQGVHVEHADNGEDGVQEMLTHYPEPVGTGTPQPSETLPTPDGDIEDKSTHDQRYPKRERMQTTFWSPASGARLARQVPVSDPVSIAEALQGS